MKIPRSVPIDVIRMGDVFVELDSRAAHKRWWVFRSRTGSDGLTITLRADFSMRETPNSSCPPQHREVSVAALLAKYGFETPNNHPSATVVWRRPSVRKALEDR